MPPTQQFNITLPRELAEAVEQKVRAGTYPSVSEVLREGVRALLERDEAVEHWLRKDVAESYDHYRSNPGDVVEASQVLQRIRTRATAHGAAIDDE